MLGRTIGTYRVLSKIGEGGMGTVFVGEHTLLGRRAAIKVLLPEMSARASVVNRFFNEARVITSISDPGIVQVFDYGVHEGSAYIVMELLEGETIQARLKRLRRLPAIEVVRLGRQIARSLSAAHAKNIVHRDLKPENIFIIGDPVVTGGERTKILDFGIAKLLQTDDDPENMKTQTGMLIGTPVYMSPEQCRGAGEVDHRSDIYSLGCVLFRMLSGRPPFEGRGGGEIIASHLKEPPRLISTIVDDVPPDVEHVVQQCLAKDPAERPQTAVELANLLGAIEQRTSSQTPIPSFAPPVLGVHDAETVHLSPPAHMLEASTPTTMQGASGQTSQPHAGTPRKRTLRIVAGIAACLLTGSVIALVTETGRLTGGTSGTVQPMASPSPEPSPAPTPPTPREAETQTATPTPPPPTATPTASTTPTPTPSATPPVRKPTSRATKRTPKTASKPKVTTPSDTPSKPKPRVIDRAD